jgi:DNA-binding MarR family transcriptional regulator
MSQRASSDDDPASDDDPTFEAASDAVDAIIQQWRQERPDVDVSSMAVFGRLQRIERLLRPQIEAVFSSHGLSSWEFDVLATLRRSGDPYELTAGELVESMMVASGTVTHRINQLEKRKLVQRRTNPHDRREVWVGLTRKGLALINQSMPDHAANQRRLLAGLSATEHRQLDELLRVVYRIISPDDN